MSVRDYVKMIAGEFVLLLVAATALGYTVSSAFYASAPFMGSFVVPLAICGVLLAVLYAVSYSKRTLLVGGVALGVVLLVLLVLGIVAAGGANAFADSSDNAFLYVVVVALVALLSFAMTRNRMLAIAYAVIGCFASALVEFMFEEYHLWAALVFAFACVAYLIYQNYRLSLKGTVSKKTSFPAAAGTAIGASVLAGLLACGAAFTVLALANPSAAEIKLFTEYRAFEELPRRGTNAELAITDPDRESALVGDDTSDAQQDEDQDDEQDADQEDGNNENPLAASLQNLGSAIGYSIDGTTEMLNLITYNLPWWGWVLFVLAVIAIIALPIAIKLALRRRFYKRALGLSPRGYIETLYQRIVRDMGRMGIKRSPHMTPYEFAEMADRDMKGFSQNEKGVNFSLLTVIFMQASFGTEPLESEDLAAYQSFWNSFIKNCRAFKGTPRDALLFFRL